MLSIIIPFHNEAENLPQLMKDLVEVCGKTSRDYEIILVDDGSFDNSWNELSKFKTSSFAKATEDKQNLKLLKHKKRLGKGQALYSGLQEAKGDVIVFMDADLQDDPHDIPKLLERLDQGYDFVNGIRVGRKDKFLIKIYSAFARLFLKAFLHSPYTDINCGFKAFKTNVMNNFAFYGNNFRFLPLAVYYNGYKVTEIPVQNHQRIHGKSKFGVDKVFIGFLDTLTAYFLYKFSESPLHFFGMIGGAFFSTGFLIALYLSYERIFYNRLLFNRPVLLFALVLILVGIQVVLTGFIGELIVYMNKRNKDSH